MTKVTIISPYYNRASSVRLTLESIAAQTYGDFEALIWDDCSPDDTFAELKNIQAELNDPRIKVYQHNPNLGLTQGLNDAIQRSTGEYIAVVGSGDVCTPDRIEKQVKKLEEFPNAPFCATRSITVDEVTGRQFSDETFNKEHINTDDIASACPFTHGSVMYRKSALVSIGGYDPIFKWCADWDIFFRLLEVGTATYISDDLYHRYARMDGVSFAPKKSVEQIKYKHLALSLAGLSEHARTDFKERVRHEGLDQALEHRRNDIIRDLRAREIKLTLLGRREAASELKHLIDTEFGSSFKWRTAACLAQILKYSPINQDTAIAFARNIKNGLKPRSKQ